MVQWNSVERLGTPLFTQQETSHDEVGLQNNSPAFWTRLSADALEKKLRAETTKGLRGLIDHGEKGRENR